MSYELRRVEQGDFAYLGRIDARAMADNAIAQVLARYLPDDGRARMFANWVQSIWTTHKDTCWKVVDLRSGAIVAFAIYRFEYDTTTEEEEPDARMMEHQQQPETDLERAMNNIWSRWMAFAQANIKGRRHAGRSRSTVRSRSTCTKLSQCCKLSRQNLRTGVEV